MSNRALAWAWGQTGLTSTQKFLLVALADFADEGHSCYPGQDRLAAMVGVSREAVSRNMRRLQETGLLRVEKRYREGGYRSSNRYVLAVDSSLCDPKSRDPKSCDLNADPMCASTPISCDPGSQQEPSVEPSVEPSDIPLFDVPASPIDIDAEFERAWTAWPKKVGRKDAAARFARIVKAKTMTAPELADQIVRFGEAHVAAGTPREYVKNLAAWLNGERWTDELPAPRTPQAPVSAFERARAGLINDIQGGMYGPHRGEDAARRRIGA